MCRCWLTFNRESFSRPFHSGPEVAVVAVENPERINRDHLEETERAVDTNLDGDTAELENMIQGFLQSLAETKNLDGAAPRSLRSWMELAEAWRILEALRHCRGNRSAAARELGIGRRTLYAKMERLGIGRREESAGPPLQAPPANGYEVRKAS